jgi:hypothetical protein
MHTANFMIPEPMMQEMFGGERDPRQVADERRWFAHELRGTTRWKPDLDALRDVRDKVVIGIGIGEESSGQLCDRASRALGEAIDVEPTIFPGGHTGFAEDPARFAAALRPLLG